MPKLSRADRDLLAEKRLLVNLRAHGVAIARTLEQKIGDGGPYNQRIDPHILTPVRNRLIQEGTIREHEHGGVTWYFPADITQAKLDERYHAQLPVYQQLHAGSLPKRLGQTLEIATYKALLDGPLEEFSGRYFDLTSHDDSAMYRKEEPPQHIGRRTLSGNQNLDFLIRHPTAGYLGVECKNVRVWLYPQDDDITEALQKCLALNAVPVIIARRIPYATFAVLSRCGVIIHQTYNQLLPSADAEIAALAKQKDLLGFHDIRLGNEPDGRMVKFITKNLPLIADEARRKFDEHSDLLDGFVNGHMSYAEFAGRSGRRSRGEPEDFDEDLHPPFEEP
ncbi:hypothetical protein IVB57_18085 [Bradyrhizobium sp. CW9]|uniref:hypothetical protein n=1 Tax=Bradyrhizobium sp. CW9 TaxID=2782689 RepID=UPI001FFA717A|nr:hypothetical protein [Bradyrhizobium sp. CW9]MCK1330243.1 hypothetical protein [Bradyrhizobium sp. CW9]